MRILTWNINGIGTLTKYHPWNTLKLWEAVLDELKADIICFQEMKTTRRQLDAQTATPGKYNGFFSFPVLKGGYSGVAIYTNSEALIPLKAEEGLSGLVQPKPPFLSEERISTNYPSVESIDFMADADGNIPIMSSSLLELDNEGRALVIDFGLFVLINLYCVADSADVRYHYKMNYYYLLQERVRILLEEGREVIVLGDMNSCPAPIDHCEGMMPKHRETFGEIPHRKWLSNWIEPSGPLIDIVRKRWPGREGMFTCWNTKISAREGNYGTRIDLILITPGLEKWIKDANIQPSIKGSDHCPVYIDLHDSITDTEGREIYLKDQLRSSAALPSTGVPRICAKNWDEFSAKQTLLSSFFTKRNSSSVTASPKESRDAIDVSKAEIVKSQDSVVEVASPPPTPPTEVITPSTVSKVKIIKKRKLEEQKSDQPKKMRVNLNGQAKLSSFFQKPAQATTSDDKLGTLDQEEVEVIDSDDEDEERRAADTQFEQDVELAIKLSQARSSPSSPESSSLRGAASKQAWSSLLSPPQAPRCIVHGEPAKELTVNKPGPNKGKKFFVCSRPVGPGYDMGKTKRDRSEVDPTFKCGFFKWSAEVKRESLQQRKGEPSY